MYTPPLVEEVVLLAAECAFLNPSDGDFSGEGGGQGGSSWGGGDDWGDGDGDD